jgi:hypothetical protein
LHFTWDLKANSASRRFAPRFSYEMHSLRKKTSIALRFKKSSNSDAKYSGKCA